MNATAFLPPELEILYRFHLFSVNDPLVDRLLDSMWDAPSKEELANLIERGLLQPYGCPQGLVLLETVDWSRGRELAIYGMVGRGMLLPKNAEAIIRDLKRIAAHLGCSMIGGVGVPLGWKRAAVKLGFLPVSTHFVMELTDGR